MSARPNTDHVVSDANDQAAFHCRHCGARHQVAFPSPIKEFARACRAFVTLHKRCKPDPAKAGK